MTTVLEIRGLEVELAGRRVIDGVDLAINSGEMVGLLGPNGAGKTTLLRAVLGLLKRSGTVEISGLPIFKARDLVGYVPQRHEFSWDFPISIESAVMTGRVAKVGWFRRPGVADYQAVREAIERVRLTDLRKRPVGELSGGQRQRVLVARALALNPKLLLLDEPFTGLDVPTQELLTVLFADLAAEGRAILMTTHDLHSAALECTRLCLLERKILLDGDPAEVLDSEQWRLLFGTKVLMPRLAEVRGGVA